MIRTRMNLCSLLKRQADALSRESARIYVAALTTRYRVYRRSHHQRELSPRAVVDLSDYRTCDALPLPYTRSKDAGQYAFCGACKTVQTDQHSGAKYQLTRAFGRTGSGARPSYVGRKPKTWPPYWLMDRTCPRPALIQPCGVSLSENPGGAIAYQLRIQPVPSPATIAVAKLACTGDEMGEQQPTAKDTALLIDVREAARRVNLSPATVYALIAKGQFPAKRVGRVLRVPVRALEEWSSPDAM